MKDPTSMDEVFLADPPAAQSDPRASQSDPPAAQSDPRASQSDPRASQSDPRAGTGWAVSGIVAALCGFVTIVISMGLWDPDLDYSDPAAIAALMSDARASLIVMHTATVAGMLALVVFGLGLARRVNATAPAGSLLGGVAAAGIGLTAVANLMGSGLDTEFLFAVDSIDKDVPETIAFYNHWIATIPWLWVGAGLTGVALAVAALWHRALPRWIGLVGAGLGGIMLLAGLSPLQYMAGFVGPLWLLVTAVGLTVGDRAYRSGRA